jgi:hypothetical protein
VRRAASASGGKLAEDEEINLVRPQEGRHVS